MYNVKAGEDVFEVNITHSDGSTTTEQYAVIGDWVKLERVGQFVNIYTSVDGASWSLFQSVNLPMLNDAFMGVIASNVKTSVTSSYTAANDNLFYLHTDHLNTVTAVSSNSSKNKVWQRNDYKVGASPFGDDELPNGKKLHSGLFEMPLRFPGQYNDTESGKHYNYFRDYDPVTGRYLESDLIGLGGGANTYLYTIGNPVTFSDSMGLETEILIGGGEWYSHAALRIDGVVYTNGRYRTGIASVDNERDSYISGQALLGPNILQKQNAEDFIRRQSCPTCNLTGYVIDISLSPELQIRKFYESLNVNQYGQLDDKYSFIGNNCANLTAEALKSGTSWYHDLFISDVLTSPGQLRFELNAAPFLVKEIKNYDQ